MPAERSSDNSNPQPPAESTLQLEATHRSLLLDFIRLAKERGIDPGQAILSEAHAAGISIPQNESPTPQILTYPTPFGKIIFDQHSLTVISPFSPDEQVLVTKNQGRILSKLLSKPEAMLENGNRTKGPVSEIRHKIPGGTLLIRTAREKGYYIPSRTDSSIADSESEHVERLAFTNSLGIEVEVFPNRNQARSSLNQDGELAKLTNVETEILRRLVEYPRTAFSISSFDDISARTGTKTHISHLRIKLNDAKYPEKESNRVIFLTPRGYSLSPTDQLTNVSTGFHKPENLDEQASRLFINLAYYLMNRQPIPRHLVERVSTIIANLD